MSQIIIPKAQAEAPVGDGGGDVFPKGPWSGKIDAAVVREFPDWAGDEGNNGYSCKDGEVLNIQIGSNHPLNVAQFDPLSLKNLKSSTHENVIIRYISGRQT